MIRIEGPVRAVSEAKIADLEKKLDARLPESYRRFLRDSNGGQPSPDVVDVPGLRGSPTDINVFFGVDRDVESSNIGWNLETLSKRFPAGFLPIASDSGGNCFALVLTGDDAGKVFYGDLQAVYGAPDEVKAPLHLVAPDFDAFLEKIRPFD